MIRIEKGSVSILEAAILGLIGVAVCGGAFAYLAPNSTAELQVKHDSCDLEYYGQKNLLTPLPADLDTCASL